MVEPAVVEAVCSAVLKETDIVRVAATVRDVLEERRPIHSGVSHAGRFSASTPAFWKLSFCASVIMAETLSKSVTSFFATGEALAAITRAATRARSFIILVLVL